MCGWGPCLYLEALYSVPKFSCPKKSQVQVHKAKEYQPGNPKWYLFISGRNPPTLCKHPMLTVLPGVQGQKCASRAVSAVEGVKGQNSKEQLRERTAGGVHRCHRQFLLRTMLKETCKTHEGMSWYCFPNVHIFPFSFEAKEKSSKHCFFSVPWAMPVQSCDLC